jgi:hypothetical protein
MGSLEPFIVVGDLYLCRDCGKAATEKKEVEDFYEGLDIGSISWIGYWKKESYRIFIKNGFLFLNTVPIINLSTTYADQFDNQKYIILAYDNHWDVFSKIGKKVLQAYPHAFNGFDAYNIKYIEVMIQSYI